MKIIIPAGENVTIRRFDGSVFRTIHLKEDLHLNTDSSYTFEKQTGKCKEQITGVKIDWNFCN